eukprot:CAMPEP_0169127484 /NCGR_PEP_ID=MMETSP1015-20121227/36030_1 /TAXON_ID=342587 /ORGANISM="Karlodinium micrum, Strain CCMP2283" /LENGTH=223 /DNA_ID=CAMNT_0009191265 /DNA_START=1 /DNA_END=672 /DNA_ORIENTATION=-
MSLLESFRTIPPERIGRNFNRLVWKETAARNHAEQMALAPDPLFETMRSLGAWSKDGQRTSRSDAEGMPQASQRIQRPATGSGDVLSLMRSSSLPASGPQRAQVPASFGSGSLGKPNYFDPLADPNLFPKPTPGTRLALGPDYMPCVSGGSMGVMLWPDGRSHKSEAALKRASAGPRPRAETPTVAAAILEPPKPPPDGFGGRPPERGRFKRIYSFNSVVYAD